MNSFLLYLFYPNPGHLTYGSTQIVVLLAVSVGLVLVSFAIRFWRSRLSNAITKKLTRSWSGTAFWFGIVGLVLIVARVEKIQFLAIRFLWVFWGLFLLIAIVLQYRVYRMRHYEVMPRTIAPEDPKARYLPSKKR